jgi:hypothetical protein
VQWVTKASPETPAAAAQQVSIAEHVLNAAAIPVVPIPAVPARPGQGQFTRRASDALPPAVYAVDQMPSFDADRPDSELVELTAG